MWLQRTKAEGCHLTECRERQRCLSPLWRSSHSPVAGKNEWCLSSCGTKILQLPNAINRRDHVVGYDNVITLGGQPLWNLLRWPLHVDSELIALFHEEREGQMEEKSTVNTDTQNVEGERALPLNRFPAFFCKFVEDLWIWSWNYSHPSLWGVWLLWIDVFGKFLENAIKG